MGTILKYIFYVALILVIYLVARGIYEGRITEDTTVKEVGSNIADGTEQLVNETKRAIDDNSSDAARVADQAPVTRPAAPDSQRVAAAADSQRAAARRPAQQPVD